MKTTVVFDIGNVLLNWLPLFHLNEKYHDAEIAKRLDEIIFQSREWGMLDKGIITTEEAERRFVEKEPDLALEIHEVLNYWPNTMHPIEESVALLYELKEKGYNLFFLSNMPQRGVDHLPENHRFFEVFSDGIFSAPERMVKPDREIYELMVSRFHLSTDECVFIDDNVDNVEAARAFGIDTVLFETPEQAKRDLYEYLK